MQRLQRPRGRGGRAVLCVRTGSGLLARKITSDGRDTYASSHRLFGAIVATRLGSRPTTRAFCAQFPPTRGTPPRPAGPPHPLPAQSLLPRPGRCTVALLPNSSTEEAAAQADLQQTLAFLAHPRVG